MCRKSACPLSARWLASASSEAMSESRYAPYPAIRYVPVITAQSRNTAAANRPPSRFCLIVASSAFRLAFVSIVLLYHRRKKAVKPSLSPFTNAPSVVTLCGEISIFFPFNLFVSPKHTEEAFDMTLNSLRPARAPSSAPSAAGRAAPAFSGYGRHPRRADHARQVRADGRPD